MQECLSSPMKFIFLTYLVAIALSAQVECLDDQRLFGRKTQARKLGKVRSSFSKVPDVEPEDYDKL
jgi:hypothetical protein